MRIIGLLIIAILSFTIGRAQYTVISDDSIYIPTSTNALLEVHSNNGNKGVLVPRLTTAQRTALVTVSPADNSLLVYDSDTKTYWYWDGTSWVEIVPGGTDDQLLTLSNDTLYIENGNWIYLGNLNDNDWIISGNNEYSGVSGNVGIGTTNPGGKLEVNMGNDDYFRVWQNQIGVEMRSGTTSGTPFIDFSNDASSDYDARIRLTGSDSLAIEGTNVGIGTVTPTEKLDVSGNIKMSGALMPNNDPGTSGYLLKSQGSGLPPVWEAPASVPLYGNNASSVSLSSLVTTTNTSAWEDISGATLTFTPEHSIFYIFSSLCARLADNSGMAQFGQAMIQVRVLVNGVEVAKAATTITDFDEDYYGNDYVVTSGTISFSGVRASATIGSSTTVKLQWKPALSWASSPWRVEINPTLTDVADHCVLTVFD